MPTPRVKTSKTCKPKNGLPNFVPRRKSGAQNSCIGLLPLLLPVAGLLDSWVPRFLGSCVPEFWLGPGRVALFPASAVCSGFGMGSEAGNFSLQIPSDDPVSMVPLGTTPTSNRLRELQHGSHKIL